MSVGEPQDKELLKPWNSSLNSLVGLFYHNFEGNNEGLALFKRQCISPLV